MFGKLFYYGSKILSKVISPDNQKVQAKQEPNQDPLQDKLTEIDPLWREKYENQRYHPDLYPGLVEYIRKLERENNTIFIRWEAGGDECPVYFYLNDSNTFSLQDEKVFDQISTLVIDTLELPGAGEIWNKGGALLFTRDQDLVVRTNFLYYQYGIEPANVDKKLRFELPDPFQLSQYFIRAEISVSMSLSFDGSYNFRIGFRIISGDELTITEEQQQFYSDFFKNLLQSKSHLFKERHENNVLVEINWWGRIGGLSNEIELEYMYGEILEEAKEKEVVLNRNLQWN